MFTFSLLLHFSTLYVYVWSNADFDTLKLQQNYDTKHARSLKS
jgi:hypothetical protein